MEPSLPYFNPFSNDPNDIQKAIGQLLVVGFQGSDEHPPEAIQDALGEGKIGGVILFRRNVATLEQVLRLNSAIHDAARDAIAPPFVSLDQEGGRVVRLREPLTPIPPMRAVGQTQNTSLCAQVSEVIATEVAACGFNLNFAPVIDVDTNPDNPIIGDRAFSNSPQEVSRMAGAFLVGHWTAGVIPCGKHFPGHGDTDTDSHLELPVLNHPPERLEDVELEPFRKMIEAEISMLMTAHIMVPALDTVHPATLSHAIMTRLLRQELGYKGVVITDDLEMKAVSETYSVEEMVELGLRAGIDIFLICHTQEKWEKAWAHLLKLSENERDRARIFESANRVMRLKNEMLSSWARPWRPNAAMLDEIGSQKHLEIMRHVPSLDVGKDPTEAT